MHSTHINRKICILQRNKNFRETRILNLCYYYMKYLNYRETLYSMYDHYSSLILFQKEAEQRSTRTIRFRVTKTPLWDSLKKICDIIL